MLLLTFVGLYCLARAILAWPAHLLQSLIGPGLVVGGCALFLLWTLSGFAPVTHRSAHGSMTTRRTVTGRTAVTTRFAPPPGKRHTPWMTARHEGGHAAAIEAVGGTVVEARAYPDGSGVCRGRLPCMSNFKHAVTNYISVMVGGEVAVNSKSGCSHDQHWAKWARDQLPVEDRAAAWSRGYQLARSAQGTHAGTARRVAEALSRTGRYEGAGGPERYVRKAG